MDALGIKGILVKDDKKFVIYPATKADYTNLNLYAATSRKYVNISFKNSTATKTYSQLKTAWALITNLFICIYGRKPTEKERRQFHDELIEEYSTKRPSLLHPGTMVPVTMRDMSIPELSRFINTLMALIYEHCNAGQTLDNDLVDLQDIFMEWEDFMSKQKDDGTDMNEYGEYISIEEYRATHPFSYASGRACSDDGGGLEVAHIVSRGAEIQFKDCSWNVMMLTHEEHIEIMHREGWNALIQRYPHIRGRVERAFNIAQRIYNLAEETV